MGIDIADIQEDRLMRVAPTSPSQAVAVAIRSVIFEESRMPVLRAVGPAAVNQAVKGIAIARGYVAVRGFDLGATIGFINIVGDGGKDIVAMNFHLFFR